MTFTFAAAVAWDPIGKQAVKNTSFQVYATADTGFVTPLAITDTFGASLPGNILNSGSQGVFPEFEQVANSTVVITDPTRAYVWTVTAIMQDTSVAAFVGTSGSASRAAVKDAISADLADPASTISGQLTATYASAGTGLPLINGAAIPGAMRTRSGRSHVVVAGVIRNYNDGAGWVLITDGFHPPIGITSVDSLTDTGLIRVNYTNLKVGGGNAGRTVTLIAQPDETLAKAGFTCGASVSPDFANIQLQQARPLNDRVAWDTGTSTYKLWKNDYDSRGLNRSPFTVNSATNNHLILGHPQAVMDDRYDISVERIGGVGENYTPTISTSQAESIMTQVTVNFWTPTRTGSKTQDWASIGDASTASTTVTVTGAAMGDFAQASMDVALPAGLTLSASVTAADTVTVTLTNRTGSTQDPASGTLRALTRKADGGDYRVTTPDAKCRALITRGMMRSYVAPADVNETTYPSGNIWILGIMQDQNLG